MLTGPCPCECNSGGFCGGCGHAGCGGRRRASPPWRGELRRRMLHLGTVAGTDAAFQAYREEWLPGTGDDDATRALKVLVVDGPGEGRFEYAPGAIRRLDVTDAMTREEAAEFGHLYGVCCVCGRTLTDERSIADGIGPVCAGRQDWAS